MNVERRIAAIRREIKLREAELMRIAEQRKNGDAAVRAFPDHVEQHLKALRDANRKREDELRRISLAT